MSVHEDALTSLPVSVISTHSSAAGKLKKLFTPVHNIGPEFISLSALLLDYTHHELGEGWKVLSNGGLSPGMGSIQTERLSGFAGRDTNGGTHATHQLKDGQSSCDADAGSDGLFSSETVQPFSGSNSHFYCAVLSLR